MYNLAVKDFIESEIKIINGMFKHNRILAKVIKAENVLKSFVRYQLSLHASQQFTGIERLQRELTAALNKNRLRYKYPTTEVMLCTKPSFGLEVVHPKPELLHWSMRKLTTLETDTMLCGLSAIDNRTELVRFKDSPHVLIAGMTNAGKSVLLQMMVLSLVTNNSPDQLGLVLIDLKNEDLVPFKHLLHVRSFNTNYQSAIGAIDAMIVEKNHRVENNTGKRIVLVIDELAQLASDRKTASKLGDLASIGRSKRLNLIAATQSVTKDGGIGSMMKANFSCRLIGKVAPGLSSVATGLAKMQAHLLPGHGSFLRIEGDNNHRFQSYYIDQSDVKLMCNHVMQQQNLSYQNHDMNCDISRDTLDITMIHTSERDTRDISQNRDIFPIGQFRDLTATEIAEVKRLYQQPEFNSVSKLTLKVFGSRNPERVKKIKEIIND